MKGPQPTMTPEQEAEWERKLKDGTLWEAKSPPTLHRGGMHGTYYKYNHLRCRCEVCCQWRQDLVADRRERMQRGEAPAKHGTRNAYVNYSCRCAACTKVHTEACRAYSQRRKRAFADIIARLDGAQHGD